MLSDEIDPLFVFKFVDLALDEKNVKFEEKVQVNKRTNLILFSHSGSRGGATFLTFLGLSLNILIDFFFFILLRNSSENLKR